ncbi:MAG: BREX system P-loop protein BrxC [bacterium]|nr:BREX system P-loop protein BrxC [bacterium]
MQIRDIFARDVAREIPPVIYFHEQEPAAVASEVAEYIVTGGFDPDDPRHQRVPRGIHEQLSKLLGNLADELARPGGPGLPASWISGFYGSGKSSFAKLLGLALDGLVLPDGRRLADALLERDDSPHRKKLRDAWLALESRIDPIAVVFDIGSAARDDEPIAATARRHVQKRLGYCSVSHHVADYELRIELEGRFQELERLALEHLDKPWSELASSQIADDHFSLLMHHLYPDHYGDPMSWLDARAGSRTGAGTSIEEITGAIAGMLERRAPGKTLFLVIDEVSQYIYQHDDRQLRLQSFVEDLGKRLRGRVWLLCTGQQQLEDSEDAGNIGKLKDRFPESLRVHLEPSNIRDVVHKRLLHKNPRREGPLRELFREHKRDLHLNAYGCVGLTEEDFVEVYPLLPPHIDLFMRITSNLRLRSSRVKGDDYAIRGLLQTLGEMFREQDLGDRELGELVTLDAIYDVHHTAFDVDTKNAMDRLRVHEAVTGDALAAAKVVAMLQLVQEQTPPTAETVAQCLYPRLGAGNRTAEVTAGLERMKEAGLLAYSEKHGYKLQSTAGQEWQRERDKHAVTGDHVSQLVAEKLRELLGGIKNTPKLYDASFPWVATYSDERGRRDDRLLRPRGAAVVSVAFHYLSSPERRAEDLWRPASGTDLHRHRLLWVVGDPGELPALARALARSRHIVTRYAPRASSLQPEKHRCLHDEQTRCDDLEARMGAAAARAFLAGGLYFRGRRLDHQRWGESFAAVLERAGEEILPDLYDQFVNISISPKELEQLFQERIDGPSPKLTEHGLGLLELDEGTFVPTCHGEVPSRIRRHVDDNGGVTGAELANVFGGPPYGYSDGVVKACLAALLRGHHLRFRLDSGVEVTSYRDEGVTELFQHDRPLKRADVLPASERKISARDRGAIARLFREALKQKNPGREDEQLADLVFQLFPKKMTELRELYRRLDRLPGRPEPPQRLRQLEHALEESHKSRRIEDTLLAVKRRFDDLEEGFPLLDRLSRELTDDAIEAVREVARARHHHGAQLVAVGEIADDDTDFLLVTQQLENEFPWRDAASAQASAKKLVELYGEVRRALLNRLERCAEDIRRRLKRRDGFGSLTADRQFHVLSPIDDALREVESGDDALTPALKELRDGAMLALERAEEEAGRRLDHALSTVGIEVVTFTLDLAGREVTTEADVEALLRHLRERLLGQLDPAGKVRIRLV